MLRNRIYYALKPWLPRPFRIGLRRAYARSIRKQSEGRWPILESAGVEPEGWSGWPNGKEFAVVLTHDVESQEGLDRVQKLAKLETSMGFRSAFFLIPAGPYQAPRETLTWLTEDGFEVGVHDCHHDGRLFQSRRIFDDQSRLINASLMDWKAVGFRSGFMLHNLDWIQHLDVLYDASTFDTDPFEPQPEGVGTIFPFWVPGPNRVRVASDSRPSTLNSQPFGTLRSGYVELPTTLVQDFNLFIILREQSIKIWKQKTRWIAAHGGMVLLNVHPDYACFEGNSRRWMEYDASLYRDYLRWLKAEYDGAFWHALPREVATFSRAARSGLPPTDAVDRANLFGADQTVESEALPIRCPSTS